MSDYTGPMETGAEESARMSELELSERMGEEILGPLRELREYLGKVLLKQLRSSMPSQVIRAFDHLDIRISEAMKEVIALKADNAQLREALYEIAHGKHSGRGYANEVLSETAALAQEKEQSCHSKNC